MVERLLFVLIAGPCCVVAVETRARTVERLSNKTAFECCANEKQKGGCEIRSFSEAPPLKSYTQCLTQHPRIRKKNSH